MLLWICLEVTGVVWVARWLGLGWTLLLMIASMGIGVGLLRQQGFRAMTIMMQKMRMGEPALAEDFADTPFVMLGSILLIIPGFLSDIFGILCFLPPIQRQVVTSLTRVAQRHRRVYQRHYVNRGNTFDAEYQQKNEN